MNKLMIDPIPVDNCSLVKVIELFNDKWMFLIMRHIFYGRNQFDQFVEELSISRSVLSTRLDKLTNYSILEKVPYKKEGQRTRHVYEFTPQGLQLFPALIALMQWGDTYLSNSPEPPLQFSHKECGSALLVKFTCDKGHIINDYRQIHAKKGGD